MKVLYQREAAGATFLESLTPAGETLPPHTHATSGLYLVLQGRFVDVCDAGELTLTTGQVLFQSSAMRHSDKFIESTRLLNITLGAGWEERVPGGLPLCSRSFRLTDTGTSRIARRLYEEVKEKDRVAVLAIEGYLLELVAHLCRHLHSLPSGSPPEDPPVWLPVVQNLLRENFTHGYSLATVAQQIHIDPSHLARTFRKFIGRSPGSFVRELRIEYAQRLLDDSDASLAEIAFASGFSHQSHLTNAFRQRMGISPGAYRRNLRAQKPFACKNAVARQDTDK